MPNKQIWLFCISNNLGTETFLWVTSPHKWQAVQHYNDIIMSAMASQITSLTIAYSTVYSGADQRKHKSSGSLAFVRGSHRWPVTSPHKGPVTRKMFPFDEIIMERPLGVSTTISPVRLRRHGPSIKLHGDVYSGDDRTAILIPQTL